MSRAKQNPHGGLSSVHATTSPFRAERSGVPHRALQFAATGWYVVAVAGQLMFATYVLVFYTRAAISGHLELWNQVMRYGYLPGHAGGNLVVASHLLLAVFVMASGALQFVPLLRRRVPMFHRWNGRVYVVVSIVVALGGLVLVWTRASSGGVLEHSILSVNSLLILACAAMTWREALARRFEVHRRWALRLWLVVAGVWFFRIGVMGWIAANHGPVGFNGETFEGPALTVIGIAQYLLPMAVLQVYLRVRAAGTPAMLIATAAGLLALALLTAFGVASALTMIWLPRL